MYAQIMQLLRKTLFRPGRCSAKKNLPSPRRAWCFFHHHALCGVSGSSRWKKYCFDGVEDMKKANCLTPKQLAFFD